MLTSNSLRILVPQPQLVDSPYGTPQVTSALRQPRLKCQKPDPTHQQPHPRRPRDPTPPSSPPSSATGSRSRYLAAGNPPDGQKPEPRFPRTRGNALFHSNAGRERGAGMTPAPLSGLRYCVAAGTTGLRTRCRQPARSPRGPCRQSQLPRHSGRPLQWPAHRMPHCCDRLLLVPPSQYCSALAPTEPAVVAVPVLVAAGMELWSTPP